ncbi:hypothetical protein V6N12_032018 [Hibiscus sabdariffa]|uniref:Uncharacterized protein n=1 Tax=Hibiscus sabdariffa TaxID=183260 RepID=A0ABR2BYU7_9ROSI
MASKAATLERLAACPIPQTLYGDDSSGWRWEDNRCFTVGLTCDYLMVFGATHTVGFFEKPFESWLQDNLSSAASLQRSGMDWGMRFSIWCCLLWKLRCCMVFDAEFSEREGVLDRGYMLIAEYLLAAMGRDHGMHGVVFATSLGGLTRVE